MSARSELIDAQGSNDLQSADDRRGKLYLILLLTLVLLAFLPSLRGGFVFDDDILIRSNPSVREFSLSSLGRLFSQPMVSGPSAVKLIPYYRPLVMASYAFDYAIGGGLPLSFRLANLFFHLVATGLVFRTILRFVKNPDWAALATAWFALHPARAENVAWSSGRPDPLCLVFLLIAARAVSSRAPLLPRVVLFGGGALLAFLTKEMAVVLPLFVLGELIFGGTSLVRAVRNPWFVVSILLALGYAVGRMLLLPLETGVVLPWGLPTRLGFVLSTLGSEISVLFVPLDLSLNGASIVTTGRVDRFSVPLAFVGGAALTLILGLVVLSFRKGNTVVSVSLILGLLALVPVANVMPMRGSVLYSPRLVYVPHFFFSLTLASLLSATGAQRTNRSFWLIAALSCALSIGCGFRSEVFTSDQAFWESEFDAHPDIPRAVGQIVKRDISEGKGEQGFVRALCGARFGENRYPRTFATGAALIPGLEALSLALPDSRRRDLGEFRSFLGSLATGNGGNLERPFQVRIPPASILAGEFVTYRPKLRLLALDTAVRLGDSDAREEIRRELENPPEEPLALENFARLALRARDVETSDAFVRLSPLAEEAKANLKAARELVVSSEARIAASEGKEKVFEEVRLASSFGLFGEALRLGRQAFGERFEVLDKDSPLAPILVEAAIQAVDAKALEVLGEKFGTELPKKEDLAKTLGALDKEFEPGGCRYTFDPR